MTKLFAVRMDERLIGELHNLRKIHGTVISHFVSEAVAEKLLEMKENEEDIATIKARKKEKSISLEEWKKHLKSTGVDV